MNIKSGVRVMQVSTSLVGNIKSVADGEGDACGAVTCVTLDGAEFVCAAEDLKTLKGRPRKMAV